MFFSNVEFYLTFQKKNISILSLARFIYQYIRINRNVYEFHSFVRATKPREKNKGKREWWNAGGQKPISSVIINNICKRYAITRRVSVNVIIFDLRNTRRNQITNAYTSTQQTGRKHTQTHTGSGTKLKHINFIGKIDEENLRDSKRINFECKIHEKKDTP